MEDYFLQRKYINNKLHLSGNMLGYLSADIICSESVARGKLFASRCVQGPFSGQLEPVVFIILQIFFRNTCGFENWRISLREPPVLAAEYLVT